MTSSFSTNKGLEEPASGDYVNAWATPVNANWTAIDAALGGTTSISVTGISVPTTTLSIAQYRPLNIEFTGTLSSNLTYQLPTGIGGIWSINNGTSGSFNLTFSISAGNSINLGQGRTLIISDGATVSLADPLSQAIVGAALYPQSASEIAAGVTPTNLWYPYGNVFRYYSTAQINQTQSFSATPTLDCSVAINNAVKCATGDVFFPTGIHYIVAPIYILSTTAQNVRFVGESLTNTKIEPMANSIADQVGINAMIINQATNEKFSLWRMRLTVGDAPALQTAWAGFSIHADQPRGWSPSVNYIAGALVTSGASFYVCIAANINKVPTNTSFWLSCGTNSTGQTAATCNYIFSGSIEDCWFDAGGIQPMFVGGLNNYRVVDNTFEFCKGCFSITGGTADAHFVTNSLSNCYDYFLSITMSANANIISVRGTHAYTHNRGLLFQIINAWSILIDDVILQASTGGANLGSIGIGTFVTTTDLTVSNCNTLTSATLGTGSTATQLTFQACTGQVSNCIFDGCDIGILLTGTAVNRLSFDHVDIVNTLTAAMRVQAGAPGGTIELKNCNWSNGNTDIILFSNAASCDLYISDCAFINAGLTAGAGTRNLILNTSGTVWISDCQIGQNNSSAAANFFIEVDGSGICYLANPFFVGSAPGGIANQPHTFVTGPQAITMDGITGQWTPSVGGTATYTLQQGWYTVSGRTATFGGRLTINTIGTGSSNTIAGLPFVSNSSFYGSGAVPYFQNSATSLTSLGITVAPGASAAVLRTLLSATSTGTANVMQNSTDLIFSGSYPLP